MNNKFKICSQVFFQPTQKTLIVFQKLGQSEQIMQTAEEIVRAKTLLDGFDQDDAALIRYIAESEYDLTDS